MHTFVLNGSVLAVHLLIVVVALGIGVVVVVGVE